MSRLRKRLLRQLAQASHDYRLIEPNDQIMVAVSGGKDSLSLLYLLRQIQRRAPFGFSLVAVTLDQGQPGFNADRLSDYFEAERYDYRIVREDTYSIVQAKASNGKPYCSLCARLRRGVLYNVAVRLGANKIALGHHRNDFMETLLLNLFFTGQIKSMAPRLQSDDGRNVVIRPLVYCAEAELAAFAQERGFPIAGCGICSAQANHQRAQVKRLIEQLGASNPNLPGNLFAALQRVRPTHLLDRQLLQRLGLDPSAPRS